MTQALEFINRFLKDEEDYWQRYYSLDEEAYLKSLVVYESYFERGLMPARRPLDVDDELVLKFERNKRESRKRNLFMIRKFIRNDKELYQYYLSMPDNRFLDTFFWTLFAEEKGNGFIFISRYLWDDDEFISGEDEMLCWFKNGGEDMANRGKLIESVRYQEPADDIQKEIYQMDL